MEHKIRTQPNLGNRITATLIDYLLFYAFILAYLYAFGEQTAEAGYSVSGIKTLPVLIVWVLYFPLIESLTGQTLGHKAVGLKVISKSGTSISFISAMKRRLSDCLEIIPFMGLIAIISVKNSSNNQRIGDILANTLVVGKEKVRCAHCANEAIMESEDTIRGSFDCPYCSKQSSTQIF